ncbi:UNVERIFIED_CONTAM: hypothetical protein Slati_0843200 [Sesamum latifolium]|uniref:Uncharacterized protein n=1 Tax=Sesamum latifolium TaxID=2727402 RepID=A0AAW2XTA6_9LAMI
MARQRLGRQKTTLIMTARLAWRSRAVQQIWGEQRGGATAWFDGWMMQSAGSDGGC